MRGTLETIVGAMFAGKTSELLKRILWAKHQKKKSRTGGHKIKKSPYSFDPMMARCHVILKDKKSWKAGADPRSGGGVAFARV